MYAPLSLVKCQECGLLYVSPRLTRESLIFHFNKNYLQSSEALQWEKSRHRIYQQVLRLIKKQQKNQTFEIGCFHGSFLWMAQAAGFTVDGCDISAEACRIASTRLGVKILNGELEEVGSLIGPQECIVSIDTLYYCSDPQRQLMLIHGMLKPGGILVLRLRNGSYVGLRQRVNLKSFPVEHIYFFTPRTLGRLLDKAGFTRWKIIPGACKGLPRPADLFVRSISRLATTMLGEHCVLTKDFCAVAMKC